MSIVPLSREIEFDFYERPSGYIKHVIFFKVIEETSEIKFTLPKTLFGTVMVDLEKTSYDENMGCNLPKNVDVTDISQAEDSDEVTITVPTPITPEDVESFQYYIKISYHTDDADTLEENEDGTFRIRFENSEAFSFFGDELLTTFSISNWFIDVIECNLNRTLPNDYKYSSENPIALEDVTVIYRKNAEPNYEKKFPLEQGIEVQSYSIRVTPGKQQMLSFASVHEVKLTLTEDTNVINFYFPYAGDLKEAGIVAEDGNYTTQKFTSSTDKPYFSQVKLDEPKTAGDIIILRALLGQNVSDDISNSLLSVMVPGNNTVNIQLTENNFFEFFLDFTGGKVIETEVTLIIDSDCSEEPESSLSLVNTETYTNSENEERYVTIYRDTVALSDVSFKYHFNRTAVLEEFTEIVSGLI